MLEDIELLAGVLARRQEILDSAVARAATPELRGQLSYLAASFRENAAAFLAGARAKAGEIAAIVAEYEGQFAPAPPPPAPAASASDGDPLGEVLRADWFDLFGHRVYPPDSES